MSSDQGSFQVYHGLANVPVAARPVHLAIGMFDGVHHGHQSVIDAAVHSAKRSDGLAAVLTFSPHPSRLFAPQQPTLLIMSDWAKINRLRGLGVEQVVVQRFDQGFASVEAADFLLVLQQHFPTLAAVYVGENFRFGRGRKGDVSLLIESGRQTGVKVFSAERLKFNGEPISSTRIRRLLAEGEIEQVNELLGYTYESEGEVVAGRKLGRSIGFPTLNLRWDPEAKPRFGVYAVRLWADAYPQGLWGVANYGVRPTLTESTTVPLLEVHALSGVDLQPGDRIRVEWYRFLRAEMKFPSLDALKLQIGKDRDQVQQMTLR